MELFLKGNNKNIDSTDDAFQESRSLSHSVHPSAQFRR